MLNGNVSTKSTDMGFYIFQLGGYYNKMCCPAVCISSNMGGGHQWGYSEGQLYHSHYLVMQFMC